MKQLICYAFFLIAAFPCFARPAPYSDSLEDAEAIAVITVTSYIQNLRDGLVHEAAILTVDTAILGTSDGEKIEIAFGVPHRPSDGATLHDSPSFAIGERHIVLLQRLEGNWIVARTSEISGEIVCDHYFEDFAGFHDVGVDKAIELLRAHIKKRQPNQALQHNDPSCHVSCLRTPRASRGRG